MAEAIVFTATAGISRAFFTVPDNAVFLTSGGISRSFAATTAANPFLATAGVARSFAATYALRNFLTTAGVSRTFFTTPTPVTDQSLLLQINPEVAVATDCSQFQMADATPTYNPSTGANPSGYNPEDSPSNPLRAKRSELDLWAVYRIWSETGPITYFPDTQTGSLTPWEYTVAMESQGLYQIFMIGVPVGTSYNTWKGLQTLPEVAANTPGWYVTSIGTASTDCGLINCLNQKRRVFLDGVQCGQGCDEDYVTFWGIYNTMNALLAQGDYPAAVVEYGKLKVICAEAGCPCGC